MEPAIQTQRELSFQELYAWILGDFALQDLSQAEWLQRSYSLSNTGE